MKYHLEDRLAPLPFLLYGMQWLVVSIPSIVIMGAVIARIEYAETASQIVYIQKLFALMGVTALVQITFGHKLPLVIGPSSVLLVGFIASYSSGVNAVYTATILGGALVTLAAFCGLLKHLHAIFTPRVIAVILMLIAYTLAPVILKLVFGNTHHVLTSLAFAMVILIGLIFLNARLPGVWKSTSVIWGVAVGSLVYYCLNPGELPVASTVTVWPSLRELFISAFEINVGTLVAFFFCFMALLINELGSIEAIGHMLRADSMPQRTTRGVGILGVSTMVSGLLGIIGPVDYSLSSGVISSTGCAARRAMIPAAVGFIILAGLPSVINILVAIPGLVMGGLFLYLMSNQLASGFLVIINEKAVTTFTDGLIIGVPVMVALLVSFAPATSVEQIPVMFRSILANGFAMGIITVLLLEHGIFRTRTK